MERMDINLESEDKIKLFLLEKLQEVKCQNYIIESNIQAKQASIKEKRDLVETKDNIRISGKPLVKIFHNQYAIVIRVESLEKDNFNIKSTLTWNSKEILDYKIVTYNESIDENCKTESNHVTEDLSFSKICQKAGYIVIVIEVPRFLNSGQLEISGFIVATWNGVFCEQETITLPKFNISALDHTLPHMFDRNILSGNKYDLMSYLACSVSDKFFMILPSTWDTELDSTFQIHCYLTRIDTNCDCNKIYCAYKVSESFDGTSISVFYTQSSNKYFIPVSIYSRDNSSRIAFLHHLYTNIPGVIFMPERYAENYTQSKNYFTQDMDCLAKLNECLKNEVTWVYNKSVQEVPSLSSDSSIRESLCDLEHETDKIYLKVKNLEMNNL